LLFRKLPASRRRARRAALSATGCAHGCSWTQITVGKSPRRFFQTVSIATSSRRRISHTLQAPGFARPEAPSPKVDRLAKSREHFRVEPSARLVQFPVHARNQRNSRDTPTARTTYARRARSHYTHRSADPSANRLLSTLLGLVATSEQP
jgi:hypothetical protein